MMIIPMIGDQVDLVMIAPWMNFYEEITNGDIEIGDEKKILVKKKDIIQFFLIMILMVKKYTSVFLVNWL